MDSTVMASSRSAIIQCSCAGGSWGLYASSVRLMRESSPRASRTVAQRLSIHGMNSNCATLSKPCTGLK